MILIEGIIGDLSDPATHKRVHHVEHHGRVEIVALPPAEMNRRRLRVSTSGGEDLAIALPRDQKLFDGAVLLLENTRAIVVRAEVEHWLRLHPNSIAEAAELGYHVGNLHWRVRFEGECLLVALEGPAEAYYARLDNIFGDRRIRSSLVTLAQAA